jgi:hypothetical protein
MKLSRQHLSIIKHTIKSAAAMADKRESLVLEGRKMLAVNTANITHTQYLAVDTASSIRVLESRWVDRAGSRLLKYVCAIGTLLVLIVVTFFSHNGQFYPEHATVTPLQSSIHTAADSTSVGNLSHIGSKKSPSLVTDRAIQENSTPELPALVFAPVSSSEDFVSAEQAAIYNIAISAREKSVATSIKQYSRLRAIDNQPSEKQVFLTTQKTRGPNIFV